MADKNQSTSNDKDLIVEVAQTEENPQAENTTPSFWQKTVNVLAKGWNAVKNGCVSLGKKVKNIFVKEKSQQVEVKEPSKEQRVLPAGSGALFEGPQLSKKEKFVRFMRDQQGWLFVLPALLLMMVFTFYPIVSAFINAFKQHYEALSGTYDGWGFANFVSVIKADTGTGGATFMQCLVNTMVLTFVSVPLSTLVALLIAVALNSIKAVQKAYQTILFLPYLTNSLAMGAVFATFFTVVGTQSDPGTPGLFNQFLQMFGMKDPIYWITGKDITPLVIGQLSIPYTKYFVMIIYEVWSGLPFKILILFSALQSVNKQYYDAAKIDGASRNTVLWKITAPLISPMISYLLVTGIMGGMKQYSAVVGVFGEQMGYDYDMGTMVGYIYQYLGSGKTGYAFAGSLMLFAIIMVITVINLQVSKKRVTY